MSACPHHTLYMTAEGYFCGDCSTLPALVVIDAATPLQSDAVAKVGQALEDAALEHLGRDLGTIHRDDIARAAIWSTVAALGADDPHRDAEERIYRKSEIEGTETA